MLSNEQKQTSAEVIAEESVVQRDGPEEFSNSIGYYWT